MTLLKIALPLAMSAITGLAICSLPARAQEQNSLYYHAEIKAKLKDGKVLLFPSNLRLGTLQYPGPTARRGKSLTASGRVELPAQTEVMLIPSTYLQQNPALINRFSGAISGIEIKNEEAKTLLQKLVDKDSITALRLSGIELDQGLLSEINRFNKLKSLQFQETKATEALKANPIKSLPTLERLAVDASTSALLKQIAKSKSLKKIEISNANLTTSDFEIMQKLPALQFLSIQQSQYPDAAVAYFPRFKSLKILWLGQRHWTKQSILPLKKMTMLEQLHVRMFEEELPLLVDLNTALPGVEVN